MNSRSWDTTHNRFYISNYQCCIKTEIFKLLSKLTVLHNPFHTVCYSLVLNDLLHQLSWNNFAVLIKMECIEFKSFAITFFNRLIGCGSTCLSAWLQLVLPILSKACEEIHSVVDDIAWLLEEIADCELQKNIPQIIWHCNSTGITLTTHLRRNQLSLTAQQGRKSLLQNWHQKCPPTVSATMANVPGLNIKRTQLDFSLNGTCIFQSKQSL